MSFFLSTDDENDLVSITCDRELAEAFAFASGKPLLRLSLVEKKVETKTAPAVPQEEPRRRTPIPSATLPRAADPLVGNYRASP